MKNFEQFLNNTKSNRITESSEKELQDKIDGHLSHFDSLDGTDVYLSYADKLLKRNYHLIKVKGGIIPFAWESKDGKTLFIFDANHNLSERSWTMYQFRGGEAGPQFSNNTLDDFDRILNMV